MAPLIDGTAGAGHEAAMQSERPASGGGTWAAFLVAAFAVVGLTGIFATYAAPLPLERAIAREAVLDQALATAHAPDPKAALAALRVELADSADAVIAGPGPLPERVASERLAMRTRLTTEADEVALRLRVMIGVFTFAGALFGIAILSIVRRSR
jgi:hypothetical protein